MWQLIPMAVGAIMGAQAAQRKADQQKNYNLAQSELTRYSPWTHMKGELDSSYTPSASAGAFGGAVQGFGMAQSMGKAGFGQGPNYTAGMDSSQKDVFNGINNQNNQMPNMYANNSWATLRA